MEEEIRENDIKPQEECELEFSVSLSASLLYDYSLRHAYTSMAGLLGTCFGVLGLMVFANTLQPLYLIMSLLMLFYLPVALWRSAATQMLANPALKEPLTYRFSKAGFSVSQGEQENSISWEGCVKAVSTRKSIIIYTGKKNASIFPREQIPGGAEALFGILSRYMEPKRVKIRY